MSIKRNKYTTPLIYEISNLRDVNFIVDALVKGWPIEYGKP
jgi:hypothetical protein